MPTPTCTLVSIVKGRTGAFSILNSGSYTEEVTYRVVFDGVGSTAQMAAVASDGTNSVPGFNALLGVLVLTSKSPEQQDASPLEWRVKCTYTMQQPGQESKPDDPDIEKWAVSINFASVPYEKEIQKKPDGSWISNTAGDLIRGVMGTFYDEEVTTEYTATEVPFADWDACKGKVNNADVTFILNGEEVTYPEGTLKLDSYGAGYVRDINGEQYPRVTNRYLFRAEGWVRQVGNYGWRKLVGGQPVRIDMDAAQPSPLTEDGTTVVAPGDALYMIEVPVESADMTSLFEGLNT